jgi:hypothetical protein
MAAAGLLRLLPDSGYHVFSKDWIAISDIYGFVFCDITSLYKRTILVFHGRQSSTDGVI